MGRSKLNFEKSFFDGEEREGFFVEAEMKHVWAAQMELLAEIDNVCKTNGIQYFADYGTLLGAVRHKGFIPWDDDIDICMLRKDYQRFHEIALKGLPEGCHLASAYMANQWKEPIIRITDGIRPPIEDKWQNKFHGCPYVVGVDIFPLDDMPEDQAEADVLSNAYGGLSALAELLRRGKTVEEVETDIQIIEEYLNIEIERNGSILNQLMRIMDKIACLYQGNASQDIASLVYYSIKKEKIRRREWYADSILVPFENMEIPVPIGFEDVLQNLYGDWRQPVRGGADHNYPFYKEQREMLKKS